MIKTYHRKRVDLLNIFVNTKTNKQKKMTSNEARALNQGSIDIRGPERAKAYGFWVSKK